MTRRMTTKKWLALDEDHQAVWWLWLDLECWLRYQCEMLIDSEYFESSLPPLPPGSTLLCEGKPRFASETSVVFRRDGGDYRLCVVFDSDLRSVRYTVDGESQMHEVLAIVANGDAHFETPDGCSLTALDLSHQMIGTLTTTRS